MPGRSGDIPVPEPLDYNSTMEIPAEQLIMRQDALPLWQIGGSTYHVEFTCRPNQLSDSEKLIVKAVVLDGDGKFFDLIVGCVMPDHVHLMLRPLESKPNTYHDLGRILKGIKGTSSNRINRMRGRAGEFWQAESYNRIIRDSHEFAETFSYIVNNPVAEGLSATPEEYDFLLLARPELRGV